MLWGNLKKSGCFALKKEWSQPFGFLCLTYLFQQTQIQPARLNPGRSHYHLGNRLLAKGWVGPEIPPGSTLSPAGVPFSFFLSFFSGHAEHPVGSQFPDQGSNPGPLQWKHGVLTTGPPGNSRGTFFYLWKVTLWVSGGDSDQKAVVFKRSPCIQPKAE